MVNYRRWDRAIIETRFRWEQSTQLAREHFRIACLTCKMGFTMATISRFDDGPDGALQSVLPGAERATDAAMAQRRANAPLKPKATQRPCDAGLFSDDAKQTDLF
jgi:hypothetical protein